MTFRIVGNDGRPLDAHLDIEGDEIIYHSRGGIRGRTGSRNLDYGPGLRLLLQRVRASGCTLRGAWLDSDDVRHIDLDHRQILQGPELTSEPNEQFRIMSNRMQLFGRPAGAPYGGSRVKKIRLRITNQNDDISLEEKLNLESVQGRKLKQRSLSNVDLTKVTAEHVWMAVQSLVDYPQKFNLDDTEKFDTIIDSTIRLPPRSIVSLAISEALGLKVGTYDLPCETEMLCHRILNSAGFNIVQHGAVVPLEPIPISDDDRIWVEGDQALLVHLQRERAAGLSQAKKQSFVRLHGTLRCENCGLDPVAVFGPEVGHACIEVHHNRTQIREMEEGHRTMLADLQCLCANCHRIIHARLRRGVSSG